METKQGEGRSLSRGRHVASVWRLPMLGVILCGLAGCGGSGPAEPGVRQVSFAVSAPSAASAGSGPRREALSAVPSGAVAITADSLMDWAERTYPQLFPSGASTATSSPYVYRFYPETQNYLGLDGAQVVGLGPFTAGQIQRFGRVSDFACEVDASTCSGGPLAGRRWRVARLLEQDDLPVQGQLDYAIDDTGRVLVAFQKSDGQRNVLYAVWVHQDATGAPVVDAPREIDIAGNTPLTAVDGLRVAISPLGHAVVTWLTEGRCDATTYRSSGTCRFLHAAHRLSGQDQWSPPVLVTSTPSDPARVLINDRGDIAIRLAGWVRSGTSSYASREAVALRPAGANAFAVQTQADVQLEAGDLGMDAQGRLVLAGAREQNSTTDIVAFRGSVAVGLGSQEILDQRGAKAEFKSLAVGLPGQTLVLWTQSNGIETKLFGAASRPEMPFVAAELGSRDFGSYEFSTLAVANDLGELIANDFNRRELWRWTNGVWSSPERVVSDWPNHGFEDRWFDRNGNMLAVHTSGFGRCITGAWHSYDAFRNQLIKPLSTELPMDFITGINLCNKASGLYKPRLAASGKGAILMLNGYDVLPNPEAPAGDRRNIRNLWIALLN